MSCAHGPQPFDMCKLNAVDLKCPFLALLTRISDDQNGGFADDAPIGIGEVAKVKFQWLRTSRPTGPSGSTWARTCLRRAAEPMLHDEGFGGLAWAHA